MTALPRPEYPRPQFVRDSWINLNGRWSCRFDFGRSGIEQGWTQSTGFADPITVPFCPESRLSGVGYTDFIESMFYHRKITVPADWSGRKILLHFGGVDYIAEVYLDGRTAGRHVGGSAAFQLDLTVLVRPGVEQDLVVHVTDELRSGRQSGGKQSTQVCSHGCCYTRTTGIWQTVWLEAVDPAGLEKCRIVPALDAGAFVLEPAFHTERRGITLDVEVLADGRTVKHLTAPAAAGAGIAVALDAPRVWSPADPFLYTFVLTVKDGDRALDRVECYGGLRKIHLEGDRVFLNNEPLFLRLVLDQGFYPDGIWTAPDDAALRRDIELALAAGFNGARLHQKVFEERFHYWADRLGYLTWGEHANWGMDWHLAEARENYCAEWREVVENSRNHPSIIAWTPLNESCHPNPEALAKAFPTAAALPCYRDFVARLYDLTRTLDPTRPVNDTSGYLHVKTDLWTVHPYRPDGDSFRQAIRPESGDVMIHAPDYECAYAGQPYIIDEFGGFKYIPPERRRPGGDGWGYHGLELSTPEALAAKIGEQVDLMVGDGRIAGYCYTQLTDVEQEQNGIYTYDRGVKGDAALFRSVFARRPDWSRY